MQQQQCGTLHQSGGTLHQSGGTLHQSGGTLHQSGGTLHQSGGTLHQSGGKLHQSGGTLHQSGGTLHQSGGTLHQSGGTLHQSGGTLHQSGGTLHQSGGTLHQSGGTLHQSGGTLHQSGGTLQQSGGTLHQSGGSLHQSGGNLHQAGGTLFLSGLHPNQHPQPPQHPPLQQGLTSKRGVSPECVSVISAHSTLGQFCRVLINNEPVIVPREYLKLNSSGLLTCSISGLEFPIASYEEVALEQGPQPSEPDSLSSSDLSLVVPTPDTSSSGLTLQDDKMYTVLADGTKYRVPGRDIVRAEDDSEAYLLEVDGQLLEVSDIEEEGGTDVDDSVCSALAPEISFESLKPDLTYQVVFNGKCVSVPGKYLHPTEVPGKFFLSFEGDTGIVTNPLPSDIHPTPFQQAAGNQPHTEHPPSSFQETKPIKFATHQLEHVTTINTTNTNLTVIKSPARTSPPKQHGACSPCSSSSKPPSRQEIVDEYIIQLEHLAASTPPRKATFSSPAAFLTQVIPTVQRKSRPPPAQKQTSSHNKKQVHFSTLSSSESSSPENVVPTLPGLDMLGQKATIVDEMHLEAFVSPTGESVPDQTVPDNNEPDVCLKVLPGIVSLNERVRAEIEVAAAQSCVLEMEDSSSSSSDREVVDKADKLSNLPGLEAFSALAVRDALNVSLSTADCEEEITDTDLFDSVSLKFKSGRCRNSTGSSANTLQQIDEMMSMNSSLGENGSAPLRAVSAEEPTVDFYRVLIEGSWYTAKSAELSYRDGETFMTMIDKSKKRVESVVKVPGVGSPAGVVFLCDNKKYSISHLGRVITVSGSDIKTCEKGVFLVPIDGVMTRIKSYHITEFVELPKQFASLKSMVAVKLSGVWKIIPSEKLAPSAKKVGNYYVKRNGKITIISPLEVYPMLKHLNLPLGSNSVPEKYVTKLEDRLVKVPIRMFSVYKTHDDKVVITYKNKKHVVKLTDLVPYTDKRRNTPTIKQDEVLDEQLSLTNTSTFSAPEYKDNLYCIHLGSRVVNVPGRLIKPHKRKQGFCKIKYRSKIFRVRADRVKLARQSVPLPQQTVSMFNNSSSVSQLKSCNTGTSPVGVNVQFHNNKETAQSTQCVKPKTLVRFPNFDELLKMVPPEVSVSHNNLDNTFKETRKVKLSLKLDRRSLSVSPKSNRSRISGSRNKTSIRNAKNKKRIPIKLDVIPSNKLRLKKDEQQTNISPNKEDRAISPVHEENPLKDFEITNIRSSPIPEVNSNLVNFEITNIRSSPVLRNHASPVLDMIAADSLFSAEKKTCIVRPHQNRVYIGCDASKSGDVCSIQPCSTAPSLPNIPTLQPSSTQLQFSLQSPTQAGIMGCDQEQAGIMGRPKSAPNHISSGNVGIQSSEGVPVNNSEVLDKQLGMFNVTGNISLRKRRALSDKVGIIYSNLCRKVI